jgi:hypothetical protein
MRTLCALLAFSVTAYSALASGLGDVDLVILFDPTSVTGQVTIMDPKDDRGFRLILAERLEFQRRNGDVTLSIFNLQMFDQSALGTQYMRVGRTSYKYRQSYGGKLLVNGCVYTSDSAPELFPTIPGAHANRSALDAERVQHSGDVPANVHTPRHSTPSEGDSTRAEHVDSFTYKTRPGDTLEMVSTVWGIELKSLQRMNPKVPSTGPIPAGTPLIIDLR